MFGPPRVRSMNQTDSEERPVLGPGGNMARSAVELRKPAIKLKNNVNKPSEVVNDKKHSSDSFPSPKKKFGLRGASIMRQEQLNQEPKSFLTRSNLSMTSCSSDASTDSSRSLPSTGRSSRRSITPGGDRRRQQRGSKIEKAEIFEKSSGKEVDGVHVSELSDGSVAKKRCAWVTPNTDLLYAAFHDEEWGVPVHEDKKLFELISLCIALAELPWPSILNKRQIFREVFQDFDPLAVAKLNEKKVASPGSLASSLLSELKLRAIIENARQTCKIIEEFGSFDKYIWGFVNHKPIVGHFRYPRQVPIKTSKADTISKDLIRRGFRGVGQTVIYSFMQAAGITNDHLISCFRFQECVGAADAVENVDVLVANIEGAQLDNGTESGLSRIIDDLSLST